MQGRPSKYIHLLRAMRPGDSIYLVATSQRFDRQLSSALFTHGGAGALANFTAVPVADDPATSHRIVRVTLTKQLEH